MGIIFFAVVALLLAWKLRSVLNKEQSFLKKTADAHGNTNTAAPESANNGGAILQAIGLTNKNKQNKEALEAIFAFEKMQIDPSLQSVYQSVFEMNPQITISSTCEIAKEIYEDLIQSTKAKILSVPCNIAPELAVTLNEKIKRVDYSISLMKIDSVRITDISILGKDILFVVEVVSQQIVYKEDENHNVIEGSKSVPVSEREFLHIVRQAGNADIITLRAVSA